MLEKETAAHQRQGAAVNQPRTPKEAQVGREDVKKKREEEAGTIGAGPPSTVGRRKPYVFAHRSCLWGWGVPGKTDLQTAKKTHNATPLILLEEESCRVEKLVSRSSEERHASPLDCRLIFQLGFAGTL